MGTAEARSQSGLFLNFCLIAYPRGRSRPVKAPDLPVPTYRATHRRVGLVADHDVLVAVTLAGGLPMVSERSCPAACRPSLHLKQAVSLLGITLSTDVISVCPIR